MKRLPVIALIFASVAFAESEPPLSSPPVMPPPLPQMPPQLPTSAVAPPAFTPPAPTPPPDVTQPPAAVPAPAKPSFVKQDAASSVAETIPQAYPRNRYEASWKKNPFLLKVAVIAQAKESWAKDFALTSIAKMGGTYRVGIKNKMTGESKRLTEGSEANAEFKIVSVNLKPDRKSSSVEIEKGGEKASLTYDATMAAPQGRGAVPGQPPGMMARPGMPVIPGQPGGNVPLPNMRTTSVGGQTGPPGSAGGNFQRQQVGGGNTPGYAGNVGGGYGGGYAGGGTAGSTNTGAAVNPGSGTTSRLGALGPRTVASGSAQNSLVPTIGGTSYTGTTAASNTGASSIQSDPGNVVINTTDNPGNTTQPGGTTVTPETPTVTPSVTRRRTLIPAPVVPQ